MTRERREARTMAMEMARAVAMIRVRAWIRARASKLVVSRDLLISFAFASCTDIYIGAAGETKGLRRSARIMAKTAAS